MEIIEVYLFHSLCWLCFIYVQCLLIDYLFVLLYTFGAEKFLVGLAVTSSWIFVYVILAYLTICWNWLGWLPLKNNGDHKSFFSSFFVLTTFDILSCFLFIICLFYYFQLVQRCQWFLWCSFTWNWWRRWCFFDLRIRHVNPLNLYIYIYIYIFFFNVLFIYIWIYICLLRMLMYRDIFTC